MSSPEGIASCDLCGRADDHQDEYAEPECIERHGEDCRGAVEYRMSLSGTGTPIPRCDHHWAKRLQLQDRLNRDYGSPSPPRWFDPSYAGESWDED